MSNADDRRALVAAVRLHRWATSLMTILVTVLVLVAIAGIVAVAIGVTSDDNAAIVGGIAVVVGTFITLLPTVVFGLWAQVYARDVIARSRPEPD